ncbi:hypothetical protein DV454_002977 [Geotrichum candidum]|nr:hypothetical protein DV454_002977 [Geotrichum candidum]
MSGFQASTPTATRSSSVSFDDATAILDAPESVKDGIIELTRNLKYIVSKLPATPAVLKTSATDIIAVTDQTTSFALAVSHSGVHVWEYTIPDHVPHTYFFPTPAGSDLPPLAALVSPIAGSREPGLVTVDSRSGAVSYWEGVGGAIANDLLHKKKNISHTIKLHSSEVVETLYNAEPAGIIAITSTGRYVLLTFRDLVGKPLLNSETMRGGFGSGLLASLKGAVSLSGPRRNVVSVKRAVSTGRDERQAIFITEQGNLMLWDCFRSGQSRLLFENSIRELILNNVSSLYPHAEPTFVIHDVDFNGRNHHVYILTSFVNNASTDEVYYVLFTLKVSSNDAEIVSSHRLQTFTSPSSCRPQLLVPEPNNTIFVLFSQAVVLIDTAPEENHANSPRRWEDIITFLPGVEAFAFGGEDAIKNNDKLVRNSGVVVLTRNAGVLRIERLESKTPHIVDSDTLDWEIAKAHIEQAVFYGHKNQGVNVVDFQYRREFQFSSEALSEAFFRVGYEIYKGKSPYLPPMLPSLTEYLTLKWDSLMRLFQYSRDNFFEKVDTRTRLRLLEFAERVHVARQLWADYDDQVSRNPNSKPLFGTYIAKKAGQNVQGDPVRLFFTHHLDQLFDTFREGLVEIQNTDLDEANKLVILFLQSGAFELRHTLAGSMLGLTEDDLLQISFWTDKAELLTILQTSYQLTANKLGNLDYKDPRYSQLGNELVHIVAVQCELFTTLIRRIDKLGPEYLELDNPQPELLAAGEYDDAINLARSVKSEYLSRREGYLAKLVEVGHKADAAGIAEKYQIYPSLVKIIVSDLVSEQARGGPPSPVALGLVEKLHEFIERFGYDFASVLYQHYINIKELKLLLKQFPEFNEYLERFFASGNYGRISWIHDLSSHKFSNAAETLLKEATSIGAGTESTLENKKLQLSIAKLSVLANGNSSASLRSAIEAQLAIVNIEADLRQQLLLQVSDGKFHPDELTRALHTRKLPALVSVFTRAAEHLVQGQPLAVEELIDVLTLMDTEDASADVRRNFFRALQLLALPSTKLSRERLLLNYQLVWTRLYLQDDWQALATSQNDATAKAKSEKTVLYATLYESFTNARFPAAAPRELEAIAADIATASAAVSDLIAHVQLGHWTQGIFAEAKDRAGVESEVRYASSSEDVEMS